MAADKIIQTGGLMAKHRKGGYRILPKKKVRASPELRAILDERRKVKTKAEKKHPGQSMFWENGHLLFGDTKRPVPGAPILKAPNA